MESTIPDALASVAVAVAVAGSLVLYRLAGLM
jgi:hypothetical protein